MPDHEDSKPWLAITVTEPVAAADPPRLPTRQRPYIYIYDIKTEFQSDVLQVGDEAVGWLAVGGWLVDSVVLQLVGCQACWVSSVTCQACWPLVRIERDGCRRTL